MKVIQPQQNKTQRFIESVMWDGYIFEIEKELPNFEDKENLNRIFDGCTVVKSIEQTWDNPTVNLLFENGPVITLVDCDIIRYKKGIKK